MRNLLCVLWPAIASTLLLGSPWALAQQTDEQTTQEPSAPSGRDAAVPQDEAAADREDRREEPPLHWRSRSEKAIVNIGGDARLARGEQADAVVAVFGSANSEGVVHDVVMSVFGDTRATGPVRQAVLSVLGGVYVDNSVGGDVAAVLGDVRLGPNARIDGDVVAIGGEVLREPGAVIHGGVQQITLGAGFRNVTGLRAWFEHALLYGRPLALAPGLGWAWALALAFLAFYVFLALLFGNAVDRCVRTLETRPGQSVLASVLAMLLSPLAFLMLLITVVGIMLMPFLALALFAAGLFGKAVVLAWIGRRVMPGRGVGPFARTAFPVLVGGVILLGIYLVPVLGMVAYKLSGVLGMGVVLYTILLAIQSGRRPQTPLPAAAAPAPGGGDAGAAPAAAPAQAEQQAPAAREPSAPETPAPEAAKPEPGAAESAAPEPAAPVSPTPHIAAPAIPQARTYAGFWIRMAALAIDAVLVGMIVSVLRPPGEIWLLALAGYGALMWKLKSTTIGGIVCNLQVVRIDGREIDWDTALVRALSCFLSLLAAGLGFFWIAFDSRRQAWHDKIAGTVVLRAPRAATSTERAAETTLP